MIKEYDKTNLYASKIEPIVRDLKVMCIAEELPMFVSVAVKNDENGTEYINNTVMGVTGVKLKDNRIAKLLLYINDFESELPQDVKEAVNTLSRYIEDVKTAAGEDSAAADLTDDKISEYCGIAAGNRVNTY